MRKRLHERLNQRHHHPKLQYQIDELEYKDCQKYKLVGRSHGLLPKQEVQIAPWEEVAINLMNHGMSKSMVNKLHSMHWLVLIRL